MHQQWVSYMIPYCPNFFCFLIYLGYNFDQITCESCKAFFRRNALNNAVSIDLNIFPHAKKNKQTFFNYLG